MAASPALATRGTSRILVASSHASRRALFLEKLSASSARAAEAGGGAEALQKLEQGEFSTLILDRELNDLDADEIASMARARYPELKVVFLDEHEAAQQLPLELSGAIEATEDTEELVGQEEPPWSAKASAAPAKATHRADPLPGMIGTSRSMEQIYRLSRLVAPRDTTVLIVGATGTGKELVARGIHELSRRARNPFIVVNCAAIPESLLEAELFGFTRGAFTGAIQSRLGRIHAAHGGTLFLDEVGELPLSMQAKLLRFVQEGEVQRLGSADLFRVDARVVAATNADLVQRVKERQFREDLYYRLAVFPVELPPLGTREDDILPLAQHFLKSFCKQNGVPLKSIHPEAAVVLKRHPWPGNVRELQHSIERAFVLADGYHQIRPDDLAMPFKAA